MNVPSHSADLEVTKVAPVFLLVFSRELRSKELYRTHRLHKQVKMMLCEVTTVNQDKKRSNDGKQNTHS